MTTGNLGIRGTNSIVPYNNVTKRSKQIDISSYVSAYSGNPAFTVVLAKAIFFADSTGAWRMSFNIAGTVASGSRAAMEIEIAGVVFSNTQGQAVAGTALGTAEALTCFARANTGRISCDHGTATTTGYGFSGEVTLNAEPTWASLGTTAAAALESFPDAAIYIPPASGATAGLVDGNAATWNGVKTFSDVIKLTKNIPYVASCTWNPSGTGAADTNPASWTSALTNATLFTPSVGASTLSVQLLYVGYYKLTVNLSHRHADVYSLFRLKANLAGTATRYGASAGLDNNYFYGIAAEDTNEFSSFSVVVYASAVSQTITILPESGSDGLGGAASDHISHCDIIIEPIALL